MEVIAMNVLEKILEEIKEKCVELSKNHWGDDECHLVGKGIQSMYTQTEKIIRSYMGETPFTNVESNIDEIASIDSAIKILKNMQNPRIDYADMVGAPAFCHGKRYVFPEPKDYAIQTALVALNEKKECNIHENNVVEKNMDNKCSECSQRKWYQKGYEGGKNCNVSWIPVEDGLPEEHKSMFAKLKGTHMWNNAMFEKVSDEVNVTIELEDGTRKTTTSHTLDGKWKVEKECVVNKKVIAWRPLPEPYKPKKDTSATEHVMSRFMKVE